MPTFYVSDQELGGGVYKFVDGTLTEQWTPSSLYPAFISFDGQGNIIATGQPSAGSGGTFQAALGYRLDPDLNLMDGMWGATLADGTGYWRDANNSRVYWSINPNFDGTGATYDPVTGHVLLATIMRRQPDESSSMDSERQITHVTPDGQFLFSEADPASTTPTWFLTGGDNHGVAALGGKIYIIFNSTSIAEYDPTTHVTRVAYNCFYTIDPQDMTSDETSGKLWILGEFADGDGEYRAKSFFPSDVPWGTTSPSVVGGSVPFTDQVIVASDNEGFGYFGGNWSFDLVGDGTLLVAGHEWTSGDLSFYTVPIAGGSPTLLYRDTTGALNGYAWDMLVVRGATPQIDGKSRGRRNHFGRGRP